MYLCQSNAWSEVLQHGAQYLAIASLVFFYHEGLTVAKDAESMVVSCRGREG